MQSSTIIRITSEVLRCSVSSSKKHPTGTNGKSFFFETVTFVEFLLFKATITPCDLSPRFFCTDATLLCEFESDKI